MKKWLQAIVAVLVILAIMAWIEKPQSILDTEGFHNG